MAADGALGSTAISVFVEDDTRITTDPAGDSEWATLNFGSPSARLTIFASNANLARLRDALNEHLAGA
jgi:hypothetical protein